MVPLGTGVTASIPGDIAQAGVSALASFFGDFVSGFVKWAMAGVAQAMTATTDLSLTSGWLQGPWASMVSVAGVLAVPLFLAGVVQVVVRGEGPGGLAKLLGRLVAAAMGTMVALACVRLVLALVDYACAVVERAAGGSVNGVVGHLGEALSAAGTTSGAAGSVVLAIVAGVAAFILWLELAVRSALLALAVVFLPLALAGLLWPTTAGWLKRMGEVVGAIAVSKLVIVVTLALAASALGSKLAVSTPGADVSDLVLGTAFLMLATMGLPMALRLVPLAVAAAELSGRGSPFILRGGMVASEVSSRRALTRQLGGSSSSRGLAGGSAGGGAAGAGAAGPAAAAAGAGMAVGSGAASAAKNNAGAMVDTSGSGTETPASRGGDGGSAGQSSASTNRERGSGSSTSSATGSSPDRSVRRASGTPPPATPSRRKDQP
jgi:hypothetical protein